MECLCFPSDICVCDISSRVRTFVKKEACVSSGRPSRLSLKMPPRCQIIFCMIASATRSKRGTGIRRARAGHDLGPVRKRVDTFWISRTRTGSTHDGEKPDRICKSSCVAKIRVGYFVGLVGDVSGSSRKVICAPELVVHYGCNQLPLSPIYGYLVALQAFSKRVVTNLSQWRLAPTSISFAGFRFGTVYNRREEFSNKRET